MVQTLSAYFIHQQLISYDRVSQIFEDVFGIKLSKGTCVNVDQKLFKQLEPFENNLKRHLIESAILHFDETGIRCEKANHWIHTTASTQATFYSIHRERGKNALNRINILPRFNNIAAHDHWNPYFAYDVKHSLCNAHHLRELTFIHESHEEEWALKMKKFLIKAKNIVEEHCYFDYLPIAQQEKLENEYDNIVKSGLEYHASLQPLPKNKRGKPKQRAGKNLLNRLSGKKEAVLLFIKNFRVPFTNNQAEQDIRMVKVKQKISGCFRKFNGGEIFCRIRSYISTARKQNWGIFNALADAIRGDPKLLPV